MTLPEKHPLLAPLAISARARLAPVLTAFFDDTTRSAPGSDEMRARLALPEVVSLIEAIPTALPDLYPGADLNPALAPAVVTGIVHHLLCREANDHPGVLFGNQWALRNEEIGEAVLQALSVVPVPKSYAPFSAEQTARFEAEGLYAFIGDLVSEEIENSVNVYSNGYELEYDTDKFDKQALVNACTITLASQEIEVSASGLESFITDILNSQLNEMAHDASHELVGGDRFRAY